MNNKSKRKIVAVIGIILMLIGLLGPTVMVAAEDDAMEKYNKEVNKYLEGTEDFTDVIEKMGDDSESNPDPSRNSIEYVMRRLFYPGVYMNDARDGIVGKDLGVSKSDLLVNDKYLCNPRSPNNLVNHNCNIPNFTTEILQNMTSIFTSPLNNAKKTSAYSTFGLGVPKGIPGGEVPIVPGNRTTAYTALELYGYDLKLTSYNGEWDHINVSNEARMLSNFGIIDNVSLMGTSLWTAAKAGVSEGINNFSFNPVRWISNISDAFQGAISGGINAVLDTSDINVVATNGWMREGFNETLYDVYVMTDKEVLNETSKRYFNAFTKALDGHADASPELKEVGILKEVPDFTFIEDWETPESEKARADAEKKNAEMDAQLSENKSYNASLAPEDAHLKKSESTPSYVDVPEPVYYTEEEQLDFWAEDNSDIIGRAASQGLISGNSSDYIEYDEIVVEWESAWADYSEREFNAVNTVVSGLLELSDKEVFVENPHLDPKQAISHYVCANDNGTMMRDEDGNVEYLYLKNNSGAEEYLNPKCKTARPPIAEGRFGSGWLTNRPVDTRHIDNVDTEFSGIYHKTKSLFTSAMRSLNSFIAKMTNIILDLSFSPILEKLGVDKIVVELVEGFRDTVFFPLAALTVSIGALFLFFKVISEGSVLQMFTSVLFTVVIFVVGSAFLMNPESTVKIVDEIPSKIDNFLAEAILVDDDGTSYCTTGDEEDGVRSAQCNVWGAMVFEPWTHLQFGTGYNNLYANGYAPDGGYSFNNTNEDLVGNAEVNMGGGVTVNNWALYQLEKTKSGTITTEDDRNITKTGSVDKDLYRLVDLQAGPNGAAGSDGRYFDAWSGRANGMFMVNLLTTVQSGVMSVAIIGLGISKIEASFMFAISIIFLPLVLLYALTPMGQTKLRSYLSTLMGLLLRRAVITVILSVLLKTLTLSFARSDSIVTASFLSIVISVAFMMYKKEILNMIASSEGGGLMGGDTTEIKQAISENTPKFVSEKTRMVKSNVKSAATGFAGGFAGTAAYNIKVNSEMNNLDSRVKVLQKKDDKKGLSDEERDTLHELMRSRNIIEEAYEESAGDRKLFENSRRGALNTQDLIGRRESRSIRRDGYSVFSTLANTKDAVVSKGADDLVEGRNEEDLMGSDTYREIMSHGKLNNSKTYRGSLTSEEARLLNNPKVQRRIRKLSKEREELYDSSIDKEGFSAVTPDVEEMEKLAKKIDRRRKVERFKPSNAILHPIDESRIRQETKDSYERSGKVHTGVDDVKAELKDKLNEEAEERLEDIKEKNEENFKEEDRKNNSRNNRNDSNEEGGGN